MYKSGSVLSPSLMPRTTDALSLALETFGFLAETRLRRTTTHGCRVRGLTDPGEGREGGEEDVYSQFEAPLGGEKQKFAFLSFADGVTLCSLSVWRSLGFCTAKAVCFARRAPPLTRTRDTILVGRYPAASRKLPKSDGGLPLLPRDL